MGRSRDIWRLEEDYRGLIYKQRSEKFPDWINLLLLRDPGLHGTSYFFGGIHVNFTYLHRNCTTQGHPGPGQGHGLDSNCDGTQNVQGFRANIAPVAFKVIK